MELNLPSAAASRAAAATVQLVRKGGRGVLVPNNIILTAAHCVDYSDEGALAAHRCLEEIQYGQIKLRLSVIAVETCSDIAALAASDHADLEADTEKFEEFCENTPPVPLCRKDLEIGQEFAVYAYNRSKRWMRGIAKPAESSDPQLRIYFDEEVKGGASGGPILNEAGQLVAVVSTCGTSKMRGREYAAFTPRPLTALPVWLCHKLLRRPRQLRTFSHGSIPPLRK